MPFLGKQPSVGAYSKLDSITTSATTTFNLSLDGGAYYPQSANHLLVSLNGIIQAPQDSFTVSGSQIIFSSALTVSDSIDFIIALGDVLDIGTPTAGTVGTSQLANSAVTTAKIADDQITSAKLATNITIDGELNVSGGLLTVQGTSPSFPSTGQGWEILTESSTAAAIQAYNRTSDSWLDGKIYAGNLSFLTNGTERMRIDSSGRVTKPYQPVVYLYNATNPIMSGVSTPTKIASGYTPTINVGNHWSTTNYRFTCPVAGIYMVTISYMRNASAVYSHFDLYKNGSSLAGQGFRARVPSGVQYENASIQGHVQCAANDYLEFWYFEAGGSTGIHSEHGGIIIELIS